MASFTFTDNLGYITDFGLRLLPDKTALLQHDRSLTYAELDERANRVAHAVLDAGAGKGDRVLMLFENDVRFAECMLGIIRAGAVAVPVNPRLGPVRHEDLLVDCQARVVIGSAGLADTVATLVGKGLCELGIAVGASSPTLRDYESWLAASSPERPDVVCALDDVCLQPYTSGSTGMPKGVLLTHRGMLRDARLMAQGVMLDVDDRVLVSTPLFHMNAAACGLLPCLASGASVAVLPVFEPKAVIGAVAQYRATYTTGVPAMYKMVLAEREALREHDLSSLRFIACGSAPMPEPLLAELEEVFPGIQVLEGYGLTECGPVATIVPRWGIKKRGSIGLALPGFEMRVVGDQGQDVGVDEVGELWMRSECMCVGYHNRPDATAERFRPDGWLSTGDLVRRDAEGWFFFMGRADDMLSVGGENVYPAEVEALLTQHPDVRDVAVVPRPHELKGEVPVAFVVLSHGATATARELQDFFLARGPAHAHPRDVFFLDAMPLSGTGKTNRQELVCRAEKLQHHQPTPA